MSNVRKIASKGFKKRKAKYFGNRRKMIAQAEAFTTTPSKIAMEHQAEVRDLTAQGINAALHR